MAYRPDQAAAELPVTLVGGLAWFCLVLSGLKTGREVALRVLAEVPAGDCEGAARRVARCILGEA
jgi:hypothetical protein